MISPRRPPVEDRPWKTFEEWNSRDAAMKAAWEEHDRLSGERKKARIALAEIAEDSRVFGVYVAEPCPANNSSELRFPEQECEYLAQYAAHRLEVA